MKNKIILVIAIVLVVGLIIGGVVLFSNNQKPVVEMATAENLDSIITQIYEKANLELASLMTSPIDVTDSEMVQSFTGLKSNENVEFLVVSEPMMSSQAYSLVLVKAKENANIEEMKTEMLNNINTRKWICVEAEKVYVTNHSNLICLVMSSEEWAKPVYNAFKEIVQNKVGEELEKSAEAIVLPEDQLPGSETPIDEQPAV